MHLRLLIERRGQPAQLWTFGSNSIRRPMSTKLHVGNFSSAVMEADLRAMFGRFGIVETVEIVRDRVTGLSKGFAVIAMSRDADAVAAIERLNLTQYSGRTIGVSRSQ